MNFTDLLNYFNSSDTTNLKYINNRKITYIDRIMNDRIANDRIMNHYTTILIN